jgi:hypothetical protein
MALQVLVRAELPEAQGAAQKAEGWLRQLTPDDVPTGSTIMESPRNRRHSRP